MQVDPERMEMIRANAELVVRELGAASDIEFGFDEQSLAWVEGFLERQRAEFPDTATGLVSVLGSYLGEAVIAAVPDAQWDDDPELGLGVRFPNGDVVFPFAKVRKQIDAGAAAGESIVSFYNVAVNYIAAGKLHTPPASEAP
jgi:hypothetical protein